MKSASSDDQKHMSGRVLLQPVGFWEQPLEKDEMTVVSIQENVKRIVQERGSCVSFCCVLLARQLCSCEASESHQTPVDGSV